MNFSQRILKSRENWQKQKVNSILIKYLIYDCRRRKKLRLTLQKNNWNSSKEKEISLRPSFRNSKGKLLNLKISMKHFRVKLELLIACLANMNKEQKKLWNNLHFCSWNSKKIRNLIKNKLPDSKVSSKKQRMSSWSCTSSIRSIMMNHSIGDLDCLLLLFHLRNK